MAYQDELRSYFSKMAALFKNISNDNVTYSPQDVLEILSCMMFNGPEKMLLIEPIGDQFNNSVYPQNFLNCQNNYIFPIGGNIPLDFLFQWKNNYTNIGTFFTIENAEDYNTITWNFAYWGKNYNSYKLCHLQFEPHICGIGPGIEIIDVTDISEENNTGNTTFTLKIIDGCDPIKDLFIWLEIRDKSQEVTNNG